MDRDTRILIRILVGCFLALLAHRTLWLYESVEVPRFAPEEVCRKYDLLFFVPEIEAEGHLGPVHLNDLYEHLDSSQVKDFWKSVEKCSPDTGFLVSTQLVDLMSPGFRPTPHIVSTRAVRPWGRLLPSWRRVFVMGDHVNVCRLAAEEMAELNTNDFVSIWNYAPENRAGD